MPNPQTTEPRRHIETTCQAAGLELLRWEQQGTILLLEVPADAPLPAPDTLRALTEELRTAEIRYVALELIP